MDKHSGNEFASTHWSVVQAAADRRTPASQQALASLCQSYWQPLYLYVRKRVSNPEEAQDLTQGFFEQLLEKNYLAQADPTRGRFRSFLLTAVKNFLGKQWEKQKAQKRGGGTKLLSLDFPSADNLTALPESGQWTAEQLYERQWTLMLLDTVMSQLEDEHTQAGKAETFDILKSFLVDHQDLTTSEAARKLDTSEAAVRMAVSRLRARYRQLLRDEIARTVTSPDEIEDEIRHLFVSLG